MNGNFLRISLRKILMFCLLSIIGFFVVFYMEVPHVQAQLKNLQIIQQNPPEQLTTDNSQVTLTVKLPDEDTKKDRIYQIRHDKGDRVKLENNDTINLFGSGNFEFELTDKATQSKQITFSLDCDKRGSDQWCAGKKLKQGYQTFKIEKRTKTGEQSVFGKFQILVASQSFNPNISLDGKVCFYPKDSTAERFNPTTCKTTGSYQGDKNAIIGGGTLKNVTQNTTIKFHFSYSNELPDPAKYKDFATIQYKIPDVGPAESIYAAVITTSFYNNVILPKLNDFAKDNKPITGYMYASTEVNGDEYRSKVTSFTINDFEKVDEPGKQEGIKIPPPCDVKTSECNTAIGKVSATPEGFLKLALSLGIGFAGIIAFILLLYGGFQIVTSQGNAEKVQNGQAIITSAIIGLLFILASVFLLGLIGGTLIGIPQFGQKQGSAKTNSVTTQQNPTQQNLQNALKACDGLQPAQRQACIERVRGELNK